MCGAGVADPPQAAARISRVDRTKRESFIDQSEMGDYPVKAKYLTPSRHDIKV